MIGMTLQDRRGAVELLGEQRPDHQMGPCHGAEREHETAFLDQAPIQAVGAADYEGDLVVTSLLSGL